MERTAADMSIIEVPKPPKRRLPFPLLMLRMVANPVLSWAEDFYDDPIVVYRSLGLETAFVMSPELIQTVLLDAAGSFTKSPIYDQVLGEGGGEGLLIAEGEKWKWQRRLLAPLFRPEEIDAYVPSFVSAKITRWSPRLRPRSCGRASGRSPIRRSIFRRRRRIPAAPAWPARAAICATSPPARWRGGGSRAGRATTCSAGS
jgi:hypothetical protein